MTREQLVAEIEALGWTVEFREWCEDAGTPGFLGAIGGACVRGRKAVKVKTHGVDEAQIVAVLEHEIRHIRGERHAGDRPELGLWCGGHANVWGEQVPDGRDA